MTTPLLVVPILAAGYSLMVVSMLAAATMLTWDALRLFSGRATSDRVAHQREYAAEVGTTVTSLASLLFVVLVLTITAGAGIAALAVFYS
ncbi:MAG: hypothetical protein EPO22_11375 [Dehalococcoidia bacterium]|nr:MAG: hypothetical protein EPO22_11375 [Dehalococcoidia bacterium]